MKTKSPYSLRRIAFIVILAGAIGSVGMTWYMGRKNSSFLLVFLFLIWVLSPFIGLIMANWVSKRFTVFTQYALYCLIVALSVLSLFFYSGFLHVPGTKPAFVFLIFPLVSWFLVTVIIFATEALTRKD